MSVVFSIIGTLLIGLFAIILIGFPSLSVLSSYGEPGRVAGMAIVFIIAFASFYMSFWKRGTCPTCDTSVVRTKWAHRNGPKPCDDCYSSIALAPHFEGKTRSASPTTPEAELTPITPPPHALTPAQPTTTKQVKSALVASLPEPRSGTLVTGKNMSTRTPHDFPSLLSDYVKREFGHLYDRMVDHGTLPRDLAGRNLSMVVDYLSEAHHEISEWHKAGYREFIIVPHPNACEHCLSFATLVVSAPEALERTPSRKCYHLFTSSGPCRNIIAPVE